MFKGLCVDFVVPDFSVRWNRRIVDVCIHPWCGPSFQWRRDGALLRPPEPEDERFWAAYERAKAAWETFVRLPVSSRSMLFHMLGSSSRTRQALGWRNYFAFDPEDEAAAAAARILRAARLVSSPAASPLNFGLLTITATDQGIDLVRSMDLYCRKYGRP
jgi:hypothetical protein